VQSRKRLVKQQLNLTEVIEVIKVINREYPSNHYDP